MSSASVIGTAISLVLLTVLAYLMIGIVFTTSETVSAVQSQQVNALEDRLMTSISIVNTSLSRYAGDYSEIYAEVENTGKTTLSNFKNWDVIVKVASPMLQVEPKVCMYNNNSAANRWNCVIIPDLLSPGQLNPGEVMNMSIRIEDLDADLGSTRMLHITTPNGVSASAYVKAP